MIELIIITFIAILMGMGIGGGGFLVIYLTLCLNYDQIIAQGTNLVFFVICAVFAVFVHLFKRKVSLKQVIVISILGSLGAWISSSLVTMLDPKIPRLALGILLIVSGTMGVFKFILNKKK